MSSLIVMVPPFSRYNGRALALCASAQDTSWPHICQETPASPNSGGGSRDEASLEAVHEEEETTAVLDRCARLAEAEVSDGKYNY
jgi:hypothetical protein